MSWKVPIPTNLDELTRGDLFAATLFMELLRRTTANDTTVYVEGTPIHLKRGQCIAGRFELAKRFGLKQNETLRVYRTLVRLQKPLQLVNIRKSKDCSVITIQNYDELTQMNNQVNYQRTNGEQSMNTNKSLRDIELESNAAGDAFSSSKERAWNDYSPAYLKTLGISDPAFIERTRQAFVSKAKAATENAVRIFIDNQRKYTPPDMADHITELWPANVEEGANG